MAQPRARAWRIAQHLAVPTLAVAVVALLPLAKSGAPRAVRPWTPLTPANVSFAQKTGPTTIRAAARLQRLPRQHRPAARQRRLINGTPAGGAEYLSTWLTKLRDAAKADGPQQRHGRRPATTSAPRPLVSAAFHDEPTIEVLNKMGVDISSVGNHEFDEGVDELQRIQFGGCHPVDGCQDGDGFAGATFPYLAANVTNKSNKLPVLPPFTIKLLRRRAGRLRRHDARGHARHRQPGRHQERRLPRRGADRQPVRDAAGLARHQVDGRSWCTRVACRAARPRRWTRPAAPTSPARSPTSSRASTRPTASSSPATRTASTPASCRTPRAPTRS